MFSYHELKSVYTIVLIEKSRKEFQQMPDEYIHYFRQVSNTGLELELLQKYIFVALDVFWKVSYTIDEELSAWLLFLSSDKVEDIVRLIDRYPFFGELYKEMAGFQTKPEELVGMYSKALEIMDRNRVHLMLDEQREQLEKLQQENDELHQEKDELQREKEEQLKCLLYNKSTESCIENSRCCIGNFPKVASRFLLKKHPWNGQHLNESSQVG